MSFPAYSHLIGTTLPGFESVAWHPEPGPEPGNGEYVVGFLTGTEGHVHALCVFSELTKNLAEPGSPTCVIIDTGETFTVAAFAAQHGIPTDNLRFGHAPGDVGFPAPLGHDEKFHPDWTLVLRDSRILKMNVMSALDADDVRKALAPGFDVERERAEIIAWEDTGKRQSILMEQEIEFLQSGRWDDARMNFEERLVDEPNENWKRLMRAHFEIKIAAHRGDIGTVRDYFDGMAEQAMNSGAKNTAFRLFSMGHDYLSHCITANVPYDFERPKKWAMEAIRLADDDAVWPAVMTMSQYLQMENRPEEAVKTIEAHLHRVPVAFRPEVLDRMAALRRTDPSE